MKGTRVGKYEVIGRIGSGSFASVYEARHVDTKEKFAMKVISTSKLNPKLQENLESEISILKSLEHPNIVKLFDILKSQNHMYLILEFCAGGDLSQLIKNQGPCSEEIAQKLIVQLADGLRFMRSHNLIHRDLKPQNLLLLTEFHPPGIPVLKIADFGFARYVQEGILVDTLCGSPLYMAPEVLQYKQYDAKVDLWAVGAILYELLTSKPPFPAKNQKELVEKIEKNQIEMPNWISNNCRQLLYSLLTSDPIQRINYDNFFISPFLTPKDQQQQQQQQQVRSIDVPKQNSFNARSIQSPSLAPIVSPEEEIEEIAEITSWSNSKTIKTPKTNPFKQSHSQQQLMQDQAKIQEGSNSLEFSAEFPFQHSLQTLNQLGLKAPLFSFNDFFPSLNQSDIDEIKKVIPSIENEIRIGLLLCDIADSKQSTDCSKAEILSIYIRSLQILQSSISKLYNLKNLSIPPTIRTAVLDLGNALQPKYSSIFQKTDSFATSLKNSELTSSTMISGARPIEQILYETATLVGREGALDELFGTSGLSFQRYEVSIVLLEYILSLCKEEADQKVLIRFLQVFLQRKNEIAKKLMAEGS